MLEVRDEAALTAPSVRRPGRCIGNINDLLFKTQSLHRQHFDRVQSTRRLNIETGGYPEDCGHCSQPPITTHCNG